MKKRLSTMMVVFCSFIISGHAMAVDLQIKPKELKKKEIPKTDMLKADKSLPAAQPSCTYQLNPSPGYAVVPTSTSGNKSYNVLTKDGCSWTASSNSPSWLTISSGAKGTGNGIVKASWAANASGSVRLGNLTIAGNQVVIKQSGAPCDITLKTTSQSFSAAGGPGTLDLSAPKQCVISFSASSNDPTWLSTPSGETNVDKATGLGKITYSVSPNSGATAREGIITVSYHTPDSTGVSQDNSAKIGKAVLKQFTVQQVGVARVK